MRFVFALLEAFKRVHDKTLIFTHWVRALDYLEDRCKELGFTTSRLDGDTGARYRLAKVTEFNTDDTEVFLISTRAGNDGLNIHGANRVILLDETFNPTPWGILAQ